MAVVVSSFGLPLDESNVRDSIGVSSFGQDEVFEVSESEVYERNSENLFLFRTYSIYSQARFPHKQLFETLRSASLSKLRNSIGVTGTDWAISRPLPYKFTHQFLSEDQERSTT